MKYNININQLAIAKENIRLDIIDCAILDYLYVFCSSPSRKIEKERKEGFTWINYSHLIREMPLLRIKSKGAITPRIKKIEESGFIEVLKEKNNRIYVKLMPKTDLLFTNMNSTVHENEQGAVHENEQDNNTNVDNNTNKIKIAETSSAPALFNLSDELKKLKSSPQRHIELIGEYLEEKKVQIDSAAELKVAIKRHLRDAVELAKFSDDKIGRATAIAEKEYPAYTLGTLVKIICR
ncbi:MAG: hypothetical protein KGI27_12950 [Thaumarchaeota archaeon]|nr:hypothetical protein [Nitrososphaerota archaeon]